MTILCIDDEELGQQIRKALLEQEGYAVLTACDGPSGLAIFDAHEVDAVVLDYSMPGLDGGQVAAIMRTRKPKIPILMLSAYIDLPESVVRLVNTLATKGDGAFTWIDNLKKLLGSKADSSR